MSQTNLTRVTLFLFCGLLMGVTAFALAGTPETAESQGAPIGASPASGAAVNARLCTLIGPADIQKITGKTYSSTNSQADLATMKHCEYRGGMQVVSITVVTGANAQSRFESNKQLPALESVPGIGDAAFWQPVMGRLSVYTKDRTVDVGVSPSHGDGATRKKLAGQIVQLVQSRL